MEEPRRLGNRYELGAVLGRGGMAEVFMARDIRLGRAVAVKTLRADMARDATFQARFRREAQSAASLNHPAIVAVYDTGEDYIGGLSLPYIVMEYVDGSTLRDLLHSGRRLLPERAMEITSGVLQALDYSHRNGIIHRDIKPANVMLTRAGAVKVMDFGIARAMGDHGMTMTQTSAVIGTAQYLSPEQAKGETVDARSDLYSTGCLIYELLTGRPPFVGDSPVAVAYQHVREAPLPPSHYDPEVPPVADAIVLKALAKHPDDRYQNAEEMRADIERALDGRPIAAAPTMAAGYSAVAPTQRVGDPVRGGYGGAGGYAPTQYQPTQYQPAEDSDYPEDEVEPIRRRGDDSGGGSRGKGKKGGDKAGWIILVVVGVVAIALVAVVLSKVLGHGGGSQTTVPSIVGETTQQATATLQADGLKLGGSSCGSGQSSTQYQSGQIVKQNPAANASTTTGQSVSYCLSTGPEQKLLPSTDQLNATPEAQVATSLTENGFNVTVTTKSSSSVANGNVIELDNSQGQNIDGQTVPVSTPITIVESSGQATTNVPNVVGLAKNAAETEITNDGFQIGNETTQASSTVASGDVISQSPGANTPEPPNTQISLVISSGPAHGTPTQSPTCSTFPLCPTGTATATASPGNGGGN
ncbi:MAG TPA: Stk1 family PASTA domain-containing Ser/Thr kinase [Actinocrinis sp.]|jgi:serine/threonine-protein kinase